MNLLQKINFAIAILVVSCLTIVGATLATIDPQEALYGMPVAVKAGLVLPFIFIPLTFFGTYLWLKEMRKNNLSGLQLIWQGVIILAALVFVPWLWYWNLIGFNF